MKPLILHGHERSITQVKYNREGDLVFSSSKDTMPNVWWSVNGERLGTFDGHFGAVWCIDVDWKTENFVSGAADNTIRMWACETGQQKSQIECKSAIRSCAFSYSANMLAFSTDKAMRNPCELYVVDARTTGAESLNDPVMNVSIETGPKITSMFWGALDELIVTGHDNGDIAQWDLRTGKKINLVSEHSGAINDLQMNADGSMFVTASKDCSAKLFDTVSLELLKTYQTERPVNSAVISPLRDHIMLGGGQDAMEVTTTSSRQGKFEARLFHLVFEEEFGRVKGHFGPINSLQFHPDGRSFVSGGEDGYVRLQEFDPMYFEFQYDY